ncbi:MAG: C-GCAxxG-C-C family protein [Christensenellales bacterium]|jgi:C_GCAxxG_C_C family probable redox protein
MNSRTDSAINLHYKGYNCAQAVLGAFADKLGLDFETAMKISAPFGGGMGKLREVCGALTGAFMASGLLCASDDTDPLAKQRAYSLTRELADQFKAENGSIYCWELLELPPPSENPDCTIDPDSPPHLRPCAQCIKSGVEIIERLIEQSGE